VREEGQGREDRGGGRPAASHGDGMEEDGRGGAEDDERGARGREGWQDEPRGAEDEVAEAVRREPLHDVRRIAGGAQPFLEETHLRDVLRQIRDGRDGDGEERNGDDERAGTC